MTPLRQQMIAALQLSGKGERTQQAYVREGRLLAQCYHKSPHLISEPELPQYFLHRKNVDHLAPASMRICYKVAISTHRIVALKDRPVPFTYRKPGSARQRTTALDVIEFLRRFLQHVLPDGCMKVRHFGFMHARCAIKTDTIRAMILKTPPVAFKTPLVEAPAPSVASCPTCGAPMRLVMRLWTADRAFLDTG